MQAYQQAISLTHRISPQLSKAYFNLGLCLWGLHRTEEAVPALER